MNVQQIFNGPMVTGEDMLRCRTLRAERQQKALAAPCQSLLSVTLNIPGSIKQFPLAKACFEAGVSALEQRLSSHILSRDILHPPTGSEGIFTLDLPPAQLKEQTIALEEYHPLGRLFDLDVLDMLGRPLSRTALGHPPRACLLCGENAKLCARSQAHSPQELALHTARLLSDYFRDRSGDGCAACATRALLYEVSATPKPGLVDRANSGAHSDMNFFTFLDSSAALTPHFRQMFCLGWNGREEDPSVLFSRLRFTGLQAEGDMYRATGGVNTHKGLIFSLGILCAALGRVAAALPPPLPLDQVIAQCRILGRQSLADFSAPDQDSHGMHCFSTHRITGARGQAADGFPAAVYTGLPALRRWQREGLGLNDCCCLALLSLIACTQDTNLIHRGGAEGAELCRRQAAQLLTQVTAERWRPMLEQLDQDYIQAQLSPGGCADLLAISLMLLFLEEHELLCCS